MSYNVYDMSTVSTPSRTRPALVIPGIDNRSPYDGKASMISCHGLPTPPQSALESRRPSFQCSTMAEYASSAGSAMGAFSQPSTPIRSVSRHDESDSHSWGEHTATTTNTPSNLVHSLSATHLTQGLLQPTFQQQQPYQTSDIDYLGSYAYETQHTTDTFGPSIDTPASSTWPSSQHVHHSMIGDIPSGLGPPLFAMSNALGPDSSSHNHLGIHNASSYHQQQQIQPSVQSFHGYGTVQDHVYSQPQVVVPSQLSPQDDYSQQQYHALTSPDHAAASCSTSFDSVTGSLGSLEMLQPPSPTSRYFVESDEEDYVHVKFERSADPSYHPSLRRSTGSRSRRRGTKRVRNAAANFSHIHYTGNTEVVCDGFNPNEGPPVRKGSAVKKFRCTYLRENGLECGAMFERGEHLKRHAGMHSNVRNYPCPLPECIKEIQRPDNAADHFKTHLKPSKKGKRNKHFEWFDVRRAIRSAYPDEKRAEKLLVNLQKWIDAGMPESASQRRGAHN